MAHKLEEMKVFLKARDFSDAVTAIIARPVFEKNRKLKDQIAAASASILSNMSEGFEQSTDAALANYLYIAKGSLAEVVTRLKSAHRCGWLTAEECAQCATVGDEIGRMLGGWIKHLARCNWKDRGRHKARISKISDASESDAGSGTKD
jgi:four helix bundle protein